MAEKKYYWIQLKDNFFKQKEILKLRSIAGGDTYTIIYLEMLLLALPNKGKIYYDGIESSPEEEIALVIGEEKENVKIAVSIFKKMNLLKEGNDDDILLTQFPCVIGSETQSASRMRKLREKKKELGHRHIVTPALRSSDKSVATDIELELELELELEKKKELELELKKKIKKEKSPSPEKKTSFAEFVTLTQTEYDTLLTNLESEQAVKECIAILDNYKGSSGKKYKSDYRAILSWVVDKYRAKKKDSSTTLSKSTQAAEEAIRMLKERSL